MSPITIGDHRQRIVNVDDIIALRNHHGPVTATPVPVASGATGTELRAWYPLRETSGTANRYGVDYLDLFGETDLAIGKGRGGIDYVASRRPDRLFAFGSNPTGVNNWWRVGGNLFEVPSDGGVMTLLDTATVEMNSSKVTCNSIPGKAGFVGTSGILDSGTTFRPVKVAVVSATDDGVSLDFSVQFTRADLAVYFAGIGTHTPFVETDCCFDHNDKLWVFLAVWNGSMTVPPAIIALRFNAAGVVEFSQVVHKPALDGDTHSDGAISIINGDIEGSARKAAVAHGSEVWLSYWTAQIESQASVVARIRTGIVKFDGSGGVVNEILYDDQATFGGVGPMLFSGSRTDTTITDQVKGNGNGVILLPYVMFTDHWVTDSDETLPLTADPTVLRYLRSWGVAENTYAEWESTVLHLNPHDTLVLYLQNTFNGGMPLTDAEAEALTLSILGVTSWAEAEATYGPDYASFDTLAVALFGDGADYQVATSITLWNDGDYATDLETHGTPRATFLIPHNQLVKSLGYRGMLMTDAPTLAAVTVMLPAIPAWLEQLGGLAPEVAAIVIGFGGDAVADVRGTANVIAHQQVIRTRTSGAL